MARLPDDLRPGPPAPQRAGAAGANGWRWAAVAVALLVVVTLLLARGSGEGGRRREIGYSELMGRLVPERQVIKAVVSNGSGRITGQLADGARFESHGPQPAIEGDVKALRDSGAEVSFRTTTPNPLVSVLPLLLMLGAVVGLYLWMGRRAQSQMSGVMSIGKTRAKLYTTERPKTTFADVAGYTGVKREINEVVDFLRSSVTFLEIGAKIPKGILLVGPPGTGKTLLARAVAGEAGVPFLSVTGSDFMEMFVGVGASRVRDLFATARKQAPSIIFLDEIDSIGRKRGAGLGGGHDEREQTLNQMLSEMDGFESSEGVVILAATNRPDVLDPALLRPGRFDRQIVVPLPDLEERLPILKVHCKGKRIGPDVDLAVVARGTPGMAGADLANLVNEAALHAVRRGASEVAMVDFEAARDRVLMGQRRESVMLTDEEREATAFHEGGHAVTAYVLADADPVHKVTILPTGMALGATQQLPLEERHTYWREHLDDSLAVMMGGRCAEKLVIDSLSTGAGNDLQRATELARRMVRELGMSERIGPMAWSSRDQVFLGEDLLHSKDYSDDTSRVIDQEVERILRAAEQRSLDLLTEHRAGLDAVAAALLEKETIDGAEVARLVDAAAGHPVHPSGPKSTTVPRFARAAPNGKAAAEPAEPGDPSHAPRPNVLYDAESDPAWPAPT
ncbi:MAG: ATP-dependent zinc metalloprotease FtsH [Acidimicrobiales bacterium]